MSPATLAPAPENAFHWRLAAVNALFGAVPPFVANRLRTHALRAAGVRIGPRSFFWGLPRLRAPAGGLGGLQIGSDCGFNDGCVFDLTEGIVIGDHVAVGHQVTLLTRHAVAGSSPFTATRGRIVIGAGVWLAARCTILPGVTVGAGSVISAGVVVGADVPPNTLVTGAQNVSLARWR